VRIVGRANDRSGDKGGGAPSDEKESPSEHHETVEDAVDAVWRGEKRVTELTDEEFHEFARQHEKRHELRDRLAKRKKWLQRHYVNGTNVHKEMRSKHGHWILIFAAVTFATLVIAMYLVSGIVLDEPENLPLTEEEKRLIEEEVGQLDQATVGDGEKLSAGDLRRLSAEMKTRASAAGRAARAGSAEEQRRERWRKRAVGSLRRRRQAQREDPATAKDK
jgi:hypothetical protein